MRKESFVARARAFGTPSILAEAAAWEMIIFRSVFLLRRCGFDLMSGMLFFIARQDRYLIKAAQ